MHELSPRHVVPVENPSERSFGLVFFVFFLAVSSYPLISGQSIRLWALGVAGVFLLLSLAAPMALAPLNRVWMKFGALLHSIVSPLALAVGFFLTVLPIGLLMRLFGKDPLRLRLDPMADSYWILREPPGPEADSLNNQF